MADSNRIAPGKQMDPEMRREIGEARPVARGAVGTTHQFDANKARGAGRDDEEANAADVDDEAEESNQKRGESREINGPGRAVPR